MESKKKIFAIIAPGSGHINPVLCLIAELIKQQNVNVIFYSDESFRGQIINIGATFRAYSHPTYLIREKNIAENKISLGGFLSEHIDIAYNVLPQLLKDIETETPDLILYDSYFTMSKYLLEIIKNRQAAGTWNRKVPKSVMFVPNFPPCEKMVE